MMSRTLLGLMVLLAYSAFPVASHDAQQTCRITRIVDGDTVDCDAQRIRLLLIDTPERNQPPFGAQAAAALAQLLPVGSTVRLEYDVRRTDRYGRTLAYLHTEGGVFVNEALVRAGYAVPVVYPPNVRHVERIRAAAEQAKAARAGLWSVDGFACPPRDARAGRC
jgi:micrococcal nuclease